MYRYFIFFGLFLLNLALYLPGTTEAKFSLPGEIVKQADTSYISRLSEEAATRAIGNVYQEAQKANLMELANEQGLSLEEYGQVFDGQYPASLMQKSETILDLTSQYSQLRDQVEKDLHRVNFGLDQTMSSEAMRQYAQTVTDSLIQNKLEYIRMQKEAIKEMYKQVMDYYKKFPYPAITACS